MKKNKAAEEEQRLKAVERLGQTAKRQAESGGKEVKPKKGRRSGSETLEYLAMGRAVNLINKVG